MILIDLQKAFDTVDHVILKKKTKNKKKKNKQTKQTNKQTKNWRPWVFLLLSDLDHTCAVGHKLLMLTRWIPLHATDPVVPPG